MFDKRSSITFLLNAECFFDCARLYRASEGNEELLKYIPGHKGISRPAIYANACRAIELALKGYLRASGKTIKEIKTKGGRNGHDLVFLHDACVIEGMPKLFVSAEDEKEFNELSSRYSEKDFDYPDVELNRGSPILESALDFAQRAIEAVTQSCRENDDRHFNQPTAATSYRQARISKRPLSKQGG